MYLYAGAKIKDSAIQVIHLLYQKDSPVYYW